jgi:hypothetical protein
MDSTEQTRKRMYFDIKCVRTMIEVNSWLVS